METFVLSSDNLTGIPTPRSKGFAYIFAHSCITVDALQLDVFTRNEIPQYFLLCLITYSLVTSLIAGYPVISTTRLYFAGLIFFSCPLQDGSRLINVLKKEKRRKKQVFKRFKNGLDSSNSILLL